MDKFLSLLESIRTANPVLVNGVIEAYKLTHGINEASTESAVDDLDDLMSGLDDVDLSDESSDVELHELSKGLMDIGRKDLAQLLDYVLTHRLHVDFFKKGEGNDTIDDVKRTVKYAIEDGNLDDDEAGNIEDKLTELKAHIDAAMFGPSKEEMDEIESELGDFGDLDGDDAADELDRDLNG